MGCGSPQALVQGVLDKALELEPFDFILYSGDFQRHNPEEATDDVWGNLQGILEIVRGEMAARFGQRVMMIPSLVMGNNDFIPDYYVNVTSDVPYSYNRSGPGQDPNPYLERVAALWRPYLSKEEYGSFAHGGYLARDLRPGLTLLVLNTVIYSSNAWGPSAGHDPFGQLQWLRSRLDAARSAGARAFVHAHIPPIYDSYAVQPMMQPEYVDALLKVFVDYQDVLVAHLFGHLHSNEMRAVPGLRDDGPPLLVHASTAPCYDNNPFLTEVQYEVNTKRPTDLTAHMAELGLSSAEGGLAWTKMFDSALQFFGMDALSNGEVKKLSARMRRDDALFSRYRDQWNKGVPQAPCRNVCRATQACLLSDGFARAAIDECVAAPIDQGRGHM